MLDIPCGAIDRIIIKFDEGSGLVLSGGSFEVTWVGNLEGVGLGESDPMGDSEGNRVGNKLDNMMVKCQVSHLELYIEANLGLMKDQIKSYHMALLEVKDMETLRMVVKS